MRDLKYLLALSYIPKIGEMASRALVAHFGSAQSVWELSSKAKKEITGLSEKQSDFIGDSRILSKAEEEIALAHRSGVEIISLYNDKFPYLLKQCSDAPPFIFTKGKMSFDEETKFVSIVGTRKMTAMGEAFVKELVAGFRGLPIVVVSGLAYGIDAAAHQAAVENNLPTIGVLAHSVYNVYPKGNEKLALKMQENGGLLSSFSSFYKPQRAFFLSRNRIIAGLSHVSIVVESDHKGGAMSTATHANNYNRDVFAVPGRVTDKYARGCHQLIKNHKASLLTSPKDILQCLNLTTKPKANRPIQHTLLLELTEEEERVCKILAKKGNTHIDVLAMESGIPGFRLMPILLDLELKNVIQPKPGKTYDLINNIL